MTILQCVNELEELVRFHKLDNEVVLSKRLLLQFMNNQRAIWLKNELNKGCLDCIGNIMHEGWIRKKEMAADISNPDLDDIYNAAIRHGAEGGKILGAGGGGFFLFYVRDENRERLIAGLRDLRQFDFRFENIGTTIIYCD